MRHSSLTGRPFEVGSSMFLVERMSNGTRHERISEWLELRTGTAITASYQVSTDWACRSVMLPVARYLTHVQETRLIIQRNHKKNEFWGRGREESDKTNYRYFVATSPIPGTSFFCCYSLISPLVSVSMLPTTPGQYGIEPNTLVQSSILLYK